MKETLSSYIRMAIKLYPHKHGEELASEIMGLLSRKRFDVNAEENEEVRSEIKEWHNLVVQGLNNGLRKTIPDGRRDDINWVRGRLQLWESFGRCVMDLETGQDYQYVEKGLKEIAKEGYKKEDETEKSTKKMENLRDKAEKELRRIRP